MKKYRVIVNGVSYEVELEAMDASSAAAPTKKEEAPKPQQPVAAPAATGSGESVNAPMPGTILAVNVTAGQTVKAGDILFILEAMKMENEILAPCNGTISSLTVTKGQAVETGAPLCTIA